MEDRNVIVPKGKLTEGSWNMSWGSGTDNQRFTTSAATSYGAVPTIQRVLATSNMKPASLFPDSLWDSKATSTTKTAYAAPNSQAINGGEVYSPSKRKLPVRPNNYPHDPNNKHGTGWSTSQRSDYHPNNAMSFAHQAGAPPTIPLQQGDRRKFDTGFATTNFQTSYVPLPYSKQDPASALYNNRGGLGRSKDTITNAYATSSESANRSTVDVSDYGVRPPSKEVTSFLRNISSLPQGTVDGSGIHMTQVSTTSMSATIKANSYPLIPPLGNDGMHSFSKVDNHNAFGGMALPNRATHTTAGVSYVGNQTGHAHRHVPAVTKKDVLLACDPYQGAVISSTKAHFLGLENGGRRAPALDKNQKWEHHAKAGDAMVRMATSVGLEYTGPVQPRRGEIRPPPAGNIAPWHEPQEIRPVGAVTATSGEAFSTPQVDVGDTQPVIDLRSSSIQMPKDQVAYGTEAQQLQWPQAQQARAAMPSQQTSSVLLR